MLIYCPQLNCYYHQKYFHFLRSSEKCDFAVGKKRGGVRHGLCPVMAADVYGTDITLVLLTPSDDIKQEV